MRLVEWLNIAENILEGLVVLFIAWGIRSTRQWVRHVDRTLAEIQVQLARRPRSQFYNDVRRGVAACIRYMRG